MKKILVIILFLFLVVFLGCKPRELHTTGRGGAKKVCIDNVVYVRFSTYAGAIWINPDTLKPARCKIQDGKLIITKE